MPIAARGVIYVAWSFSWEFSTGLFLRQFDACPWDYASYFSGHFMGLITAEYVPVWYIACLLGEIFLIRNALNMYWGVEEEAATDSSKVNKTHPPNLNNKPHQM